MKTTAHKPIEAFRAGRHTAMNGQVIHLTAEDVRRTAEAYDPALHRAPHVIGHPKTDDPAFGWIDKLSAKDGSLFVEVSSQVEPQFGDMVNEGRFPNRSISFYPPHSPANPVPGVYYPKHLGWLGAAAPAVKGMAPALFAEDDDAVTIAFGEVPAYTMAGIVRRLRDWFIGEHGVEVADQVIPSYAAESVEEAAREPEEAAVAPPGNFSANHEDAMPDIEFAETNLSKLLNRSINSHKSSRSDLVSRMATAAGISEGTVGQILRGEIAAPPERRLRGFARVLGISLKTIQNTIPADLAEHEEEYMPDYTVDLAEQQATLAAEKVQLAADRATLDAALATAAKQTAVSFVEALVAEGKVLPTHQAGLVEFMVALPADTELAFAEGDAQVKKPASDFFKGFLAALPVQVDFSEHATPENQTDTADFATPSGFQVDGDQLVIHHKAVAYQQANGGDYISAVKSVS